MPVIRLNNVVLPAPFGPMIALRSPGITRSDTERVACKPPKLLQSAFSSRAGTPPPFVCVSMLTRKSFVVQAKAPGLVGPGVVTSLAEFAGREVAIIDRLR